MAETSPITQIAEILSKHLFSSFFWETNGIYDQNWPCENTTGHVLPTPEGSAGEAVQEPKRRRKSPAPKKTHPSDVVFYYDEPYRTVRTYVDCDLKSYAAGTITKRKVSDALQDLALSLKCAETSETWRKLYIHDNVNADIIGLLFVYNHDEVYDKDFDQILASVNHEKLDLPSGSRIIVMGPSDIQWLNNVHSEIRDMRGSQELPMPALCRFYYPNLVRKKNVQDTQAATIEMLVGPWIVMKYRLIQDGKEDVMVFYKGRGERTQEFLHLIDYLLYHNLLEQGVSVKIRTLDPHPTSAAVFQKAISDYIEAFEGGPDIEKRLKAIEYKQISKIRMNFSLVELGMRHD